MGGFDHKSTNELCKPKWMIAMQARRARKNSSQVPCSRFKASTLILIPSKAQDTKDEVPWNDALKGDNYLPFRSDSCIGYQSRLKLSNNEDLECTENDTQSSRQKKISEP